mmetsp:Transcript_18467/g.32267  ORF Transcript_18467/g.32267 Transcript_18467/m.32267 type:complete len:336 (-) Transcript_18467:70-1077(-)|eukprot:CAMPEP_0206378896 /NCGR_PEP_ID=MMETSP0294-20121207/11018_1 /ASSEMBLY_ACC=CAM_ASM_000327 /TAXON_ID=39354 /ORGANISM="Heterosigma akashiwo, Strain CCMP2393" /LENGTH=335 /DNA_ID=CAMNT_0053827635 /DNA_START=109 /DNA_END=1116 /DNA_ORIENTATION=+
MGAQFSASQGFSEKLKCDRKRIRPLIRSFNKLKADVDELRESLPLVATVGSSVKIFLDPELAKDPQKIDNPLFWRTFEFLHLHQVLILIDLSPSDVTRASEVQMDQWPNDEGADVVKVVCNLFEFYNLLKILRQLRQMLLGGAAPGPANSHGRPAAAPGTPSSGTFGGEEDPGWEVLTYAAAITDQERLTECPICMDRGQEVVVDQCLHAYCGACFAKWREANQTCPLCRLDLRERESSEEHWQLEGWSQGDLREALLETRCSFMFNLRNQRKVSSGRFQVPSFVNPEYTGSVVDLENYVEISYGAVTPAPPLDDNSNSRDGSSSNNVSMVNVQL